MGAAQGARGPIVGEGPAVCADECPADPPHSFPSRPLKRGPPPSAGDHRRAAPVATRASAADFESAATGRRGRHRRARARSRRDVGS